MIALLVIAGTISYLVAGGLTAGLIERAHIAEFEDEELFWFSVAWPVAGTVALAVAAFFWASGRGWNG